MSDLPQNIQVIFENNPKLKKLIPYPSVVSGSSFITAFNDKLRKSSPETEDTCFYKVIFKKNSSRDLMAINNGELKGLLTTTCVEKGKISDVAGLEKVVVDNQTDLLATLFGISLYSAIENNLSYISHLCVDIRNHQIIGEQARFERISETIADSFRSIPDISIDRTMRDVYLSRIVKTNEDCYEVYISNRESFRKLLDSEFSPYSAGFEHYYSAKGSYNSIGANHVYPSRFFEHNVLTHSVFSLFEHLVAGRICEIVLSGNYSDSNITRHKNFIDRVQREIEELMKARLDAFECFTKDIEQQIENNLNLTGHERNNRKKILESHNSFVSRIKNKIFELLGAKLDSFNVLTHLKNQDEIDVYLINGVLLVSNPEICSNDE